MIALGHELHTTGRGELVMLQEAIDRSQGVLIHVSDNEAVRTGFAQRVWERVQAGRVMSGNRLANPNAWYTICVAVRRERRVHLR